MTDFIDVENIVKNMLNKLISGYAPQKVVLFGSHAYGRPHSDSDIDLLIIKDTSERFIDRWSTVQGLLTGLHNSVPVETLVLTPDEVSSRLRKGDQFIAEILQKGRILYAA